MRAAINVRYSESNLSLCREAGLSLSSFNRAEEPENCTIFGREDSRGGQNTKKHTESSL